MTDEVRIAAAACDEIGAHAADAWPEECCGLLVSDGATIVAVVRAGNIAVDRRRRFLVDPADHFGAVRAARACGRAVVGAYHSHPEGEPRPSATDRVEAYEDPEFVHLIVGSTRAKDPAFAAYRFVAGNFVPLPLVRVP